MLARDASLGVTHAIYAPQNTLRSSLKDVSDNWGWEGECSNGRLGLRPLPALKVDRCCEQRRFGSSWASTSARESGCQVSLAVPINHGEGAARPVG